MAIYQRGPTGSFYCKSVKFSHSDIKFGKLHCSESKGRGGKGKRMVSAHSLFSIVYIPTIVCQFRKPHDISDLFPGFDSARLTGYSCLFSLQLENESVCL